MVGPRRPVLQASAQAVEAHLRVAAARGVGESYPPGFCYGAAGGFRVCLWRAAGGYTSGANGYEEASSTGGYGKPDKDAAGYGPHAHAAGALYGGHHQASQLHAAPAQYQVCGPTGPPACMQGNARAA